MTVTRGLALLLTVAAAGAFVNASSPDGPAAVSSARLKTISARVSSKGASLVIEASDPVGYVATYPDPLTVVLDFRNVVADGVANSFVGSAKNPIASVTVEPTELVGAPASRVRVTLGQPMGHHVRAERNTVVVDFDKADAHAAPYVLPPTHNAAAPDAMSAVRGAGAPGVEIDQSARSADPIAALGLDRSDRKPAIGAPQAAPSAAVRQTAQATAVAVLQPSTQGTPTKYTGSPLSLDLQGADLRAVLRTFSEISGLNMVIDPAVNGTVDVALHDVPWDQALELILRANKLGYTVDGTILRIAPLSTLADEQTQLRKLEDERALAGDLVSSGPIRLSYAKAAELQQLVEKQLSQRGTFTMDPRTNQIIVRDLPDRVQKVTDLVTLLDIPQPQVEIEARIVQSNKNFSRQLGIQWGFNGLVSPQLGNTTGLAFPNNGALGGAATGAGQSGIPANTAVNLPIAGNSGVHLSLGSINGAFNLDATLMALEQTGNGRILSSPKVTTMNNVQAEMTQGTQIPLQVSANNTVTTIFKDAALQLKVTPQITAAGTVIMLVSLENSQPDFGHTGANGVPSINTQRALTTVLVSDGQTTVIGGVFTTQETNAQNRTPLLGTIPLLRWLFKSDSVQSQDQELLIFLTPRIVKL